MELWGVDIFVCSDSCILNDKIIVLLVKEKENSTCLNTGLIKKKKVCALLSRKKVERNLFMPPVQQKGFDIVFTPGLETRVNICCKRKSDNPKLSVKLI